ncbi:DUF2968 domain-containing protein [Paraburkholderia kururiensis]|uniref:DUF2968 domain-containing protein n=1 Tax=Paraburkholderia kururiensis TaxID=984307 RepID=UPI000F86B25B|nr:DUF2968 domain-containing protein [Paraburkholderia kururiensis]
MKNLLSRRSSQAPSAPSDALDTPAEGATSDPADEDPPDTVIDTAGETAQSMSQARAMTVVTPQPAQRGIQMADVTELQRLVATESIVQFRSFRSFDYSAVLLFHGDAPDYYVALYHDAEIWRAFVAVDLEPAEAVFRNVQDQIIKMTEGETRRAQIRSQNERVARAVRQSEALAERLRNDIERDVTQTQLSNAKQHDIRRELAQLEAQRVAVQAQLNRAVRQVHSLRLTNNEGLPHLQTRRDDGSRK